MSISRILIGSALCLSLLACRDKPQASVTSNEQLKTSQASPRKPRMQAPKLAEASLAFKTASQETKKGLSSLEEFLVKSQAEGKQDDEVKALLQLTQRHFDWGGLQKAESYANSLIELQMKRWGKDSYQVLFIRSQLARVLLRQQRYDEAHRLLKENVEGFAKISEKAILSPTMRAGDAQYPHFFLALYWHNNLKNLSQLSSFKGPDFNQALQKKMNQALQNYAKTKNVEDALE